MVVLVNLQPFVILLQKLLNYFDFNLNYICKLKNVEFKCFGTVNPDNIWRFKSDVIYDAAVYPDLLLFLSFIFY
jgi:hypothetical protein